MLLESQELKKPLLDALESARMAAKVVYSNKVANAHMQAYIKALELLIVGIHKLEQGDKTAMEKIVDIFLDEIGDTKDLFKNQSKYDPHIIKVAGTLAVGQRQAVNTKTVNAQYFKNRVYTMLNENKLPPDIRPVQRGDELWLARLRPEELKDRPHPKHKRG